MNNPVFDYRIAVFDGLNTGSIYQQLMPLLPQIRVNLVDARNHANNPNLGETLDAYNGAVTHTTPLALEGVNPGEHTELGFDFVILTGIGGLVNKEMAAGRGIKVITLEDLSLGKGATPEQIAAAAINTYMLGLQSEMYGSRN